MRFGLAVTLCAALGAPDARAANTMRIGGQEVTITAAPVATEAEAEGPVRVRVEPQLAGAGEPVVITWQLKEPSTASYTSVRAVEIANCHVVEVKTLPQDSLAQLIVFSKVAGTIAIPSRDFFDSVGNSLTAPAATIELIDSGTPLTLPRGRDVSLRVERGSDTLSHVNLTATVEGMANLFDAAPPRFGPPVRRDWKVTDREPAAAITNAAGRVFVRRSWTLSWPRDAARATTVPVVEFDYFDLVRRKLVTLRQPGFVVPPANGLEAPEPTAHEPLRLRVPVLDTRFIIILAATGVVLLFIAAIVSTMRKREPPERVAFRFLATSSNPDELLQELERRLGREPPLVRVEMERPAAALRELLFARGDKRERINVADREIEDAAVAVFRARAS
jgi:hypothetical protein